MRKIILMFVCLGFAGQTLSADNLPRYIYAKAMIGDVTGLVALKSQGYSLEAEDDAGNTAYCLAVFNRNQTAIRTLEKTGVNIRPKCLKTLPIVTEAMIYEAAHNRNVQQLSLWQEYGVPVDLINVADGNTALCHAVYEKDCAAIDVLLKAGASEYHNCMRRIPQKVRQELDCKPVIIDWERVGLTALGLGLVAGGVAVALSGGGSSGESCAMNQHWDGEKCVTCPDMQCWDGHSCRVAYEGEYTDPSTNRCLKIAPPPYTDGTYSATSFETNEYNQGGFLGDIQASSAYAHGYTGYIIDRVKKNKFGALMHGQSSTQGEASDITSDRVTVGILSTGTDITNKMNDDQVSRYVNKDLAYQETDDEGNTVWKGNLAQDGSGHLLGYNFDYGYFPLGQIGSEREDYYTSGTIRDFTGSSHDNNSVTYLALHGHECNSDSGYCGIALVPGTLASILPYKIVDIAACGKTERCLFPPDNITGYIYATNYDGTGTYIYEDNVNNSAPHYYLNGAQSKSRSWNQGTMLAGIIAAIKNEDQVNADPTLDDDLKQKNMHGVAYDAQIIPAVADIFRPITQNSIETLTGAGADIILQDVIFDAGPNYPQAGVIKENTIASIYGADTAAAYQNIVNTKTILIAGTGVIQGLNSVASGIAYNNGSAWYEKEASISTMAPLASDGENLKKLFLSVTAVQKEDAANSYGGYTLTSYAQPCGSTASYCLSAPGGTGQTGTNLYSTIATQSGTGGVDQYNWGEDYGTSAAAAVVAGAAAVLKGAYPHLTSQEIVTLLQRTATPLGACAGGGSADTNGDSCTTVSDAYGIGGYSTFYGWGLVNLEAATQPVGALWVNEGTTTNINPYIGTYSISGSSLGASSVMSQSVLNALPSTFTAFDSFNRPFAVNTGALLSAHSVRREFDDDFKAFMHGRDVTKVKANDQFSMTYAPRTSRRSSEMKTGLMEMNVNTDKADFGFYYTEDALNSKGNYFERTLNNPFVQIQEAYGADAKYHLTNKLSVGMSYAIGKNGFLGDGEKHYKAPENRVSMMSTEATYQAAKSVMFQASYGVMKEQDSVLGMTGTGAFKTKGANTHFASVGVEVKPTDKFKLNLAYTYGWTTPEKSNGLMNLSRLTADGFAAVAQYDLGADNLLGISISSPLRIRSGRVAFDLPVGRSATDEKIYRETFTGSMKPTARELDFTLFYKDALTDNISIQSELGLRLHPDHQKEATPDYRALFGLKWDY